MCRTDLKSSLSGTVAICTCCCHSTLPVASILFVDRKKKHTPRTLLVLFAISEAYLQK